MPLLVLAGLAWHDVPSDISSTDMAAAAALLEAQDGEAATFERPHGFAAEIALVRRVQAAVLSAAPVDEGLPLRQRRELADLVRAGQGLCYDRSRAIETLLRLHGMETRHAAVYSTAQTGSSLRALRTPQVASHAVSEVRTEKGWLLIDSNARWIALTADSRPLDLEALRRSSDRRWHARVQEPMNAIFADDFTWVYGLFSRHGLFYPPFTPFPDVEWSEVPYNLVWW